MDWSRGKEVIFVPKKIAVTWKGLEEHWTDSKGVCSASAMQKHGCLGR